MTETPGECPVLDGLDRRRMPLIKRYPNRKLYDTEAKRYVTLEEVAELVRHGQEVRVTDHESGEDVTSLTLAQIILEQEKKRTGFLPISLLTNLIRSSGAALEQWRRSLNQSVGGVGRSGVGLEEQVSRLIEQGKLSVEQAQGLLTLDGLLSDLLHSLNVPTHRDIQTLQEQIHLLNVRLAEIGEPPIGDAPIQDSPLDQAIAGQQMGDKTEGVREDKVNAV
jgi:polyhydroxyalkanoate synthesis repressor PhaR